MNYQGQSNLNKIWKQQTPLKCHFSTSVIKGIRFTPKPWTRSSIHLSFCWMFALADAAFLISYKPACVKFFKKRNQGQGLLNEDSCKNGTMREKKQNTKLSSEIIARGATAYCVQRSDRFPGLLILLAFLEMLSKKGRKSEKRLRPVEMKKGASLWNTSRALQRKRRACPLGTLLGTMPTARRQRDTDPPG